LHLELGLFSVRSTHRSVKQSYIVNPARIPKYRDAVANPKWSCVVAANTTPAIALPMSLCIDMPRIMRITVPRAIEGLLQTSKEV
jgi:hypothetical protein